MQGGGLEKFTSGKNVRLIFVISFRIGKIKVQSEEKFKIFPKYGNLVLLDQLDHLVFPVKLPSPRQ